MVPNRLEEAAQDSESRFVAGTTAMFFDSRRGTPTYREIKGFVWDVAPLPRNQEVAGVLHSDAYCLSSNTANKEAAWTFIEFANSFAGQTIIARSGRKRAPFRLEQHFGIGLLFWSNPIFAKFLYLFLCHDIPLHPQILH
mgnify:FL=1